MRIAQIGVGNQGWYDLRAIATAPQAKIVALCDVDQGYLDAASREFGEARTFRDYRKLLDEMDADVDADSRRKLPAAAAAVELSRVGVR